MQLITIGQARLHCKADEADDDMLTIYANAAEAACAKALNRNVYPDADALASARAGMQAAMVTANAAYETAMDAADEIDIAADKLVAEEIAMQNLVEAQCDYYRKRDGIVVTDDILAAILLTLGHLYRNREDVVTGQGAAAIELPMGARALLRPYVRHAV